jgi:dsRNA-specific ribonuclease
MKGDEDLWNNPELNFILQKEMQNFFIQKESTPLGLGLQSQESEESKQDSSTDINDSFERLSSKSDSFLELTQASTLNKHFKNFPKGGLTKTVSKME